MKYKIIFAIMLTCTIVPLLMVAQEFKIPLYTGMIPNSIITGDVEKIEKKEITVITHVQVPDIAVYLPSKRNATGQAVVICPGGGYWVLAYDLEGSDIARYFNSIGVAAIVLKYRLPTYGNTLEPHKAPLMDAQRALRLVRFNAGRWNIDPKKIGIMGFSAGGHLASTLGTHFDYGNPASSDSVERMSCRPDFMVLMYPVVSFVDPAVHSGSREALLGKNPDKNLLEYYSNELQVKNDTPPAFMVHADDDKGVPVENTLLMYKALRAKNIPVELHILSEGEHGFGLGTGNEHISTWTNNLKWWLEWLNTTAPSISKYEIILSPESGLMTEAIGSAISKCSAKGGGIVRFTRGTYLTGTIELKTNVTLLFDNGAILRGSDKYSDYRNDAFIFGKDLSNISIRGEGVIDGVDCRNPNGEEGFRGPHCIRLINCDKIYLKGFTIQRSANWAINCRYCKNGKIENVTIRGGHDGLHTRFCENFKVSGCDFRTGDDCFAGNDNRNFTVTNSKINTSCNGFRMGCFNLSVKQCQFWGPGESVHIIQKRNNMLAAFVHFSPEDENPQLLNGNWTIEDCTVENVDNFFNYNYEDGLWQTGKPFTVVRFNNIKANNLLSAFAIVGDKERLFELYVQNSSFSFREGSTNQQGNFEGARFASDAFFNVTHFGTIELKNVTLQKSDKLPLVVLNSGNNLSINGLHPNSLLSSSRFTNIKHIKKE